jgi:uncharacterized Ntn-hydrolase superfamily protein
MTFSIVAFDRATSSWGVAVASKFLAVGALVPWGRAGIGAIATQALANLGYGPRGLSLLESGMSASDVVRSLTDADEGRAQRQLGVVDASGSAATYTGAECNPWAGGRTGDGFAVQGNILTGAEVVDAMAAAWDAAVPFAERLLGCLSAGDRAGGDSRGRQGAALRVWRAGAAYGGELDIAIDLRVDDHPDPVPELGRLLDLYHLYFDEPDPATLLPLDGTTAAGVTDALEKLGYRTAAGLQQALERWAGRENFEERMRPGAIDPLVMEYLFKQAADA